MEWVSGWVAVLAWLAGAVFAPGAGWTIASAFLPPVGWYFSAERLLRGLGWL